jgi:hypothetical protein
MSRLFLATALLLLCGLAAARSGASAVIELTPDTFDAAVKGHAALLVKFYAVLRSLEI